MLKKVIASSIAWILFILVILNVPYPETISDLGILQFLAFIFPLILALTLTTNLFLKNIYICASLALGFIAILFLKALGSLNIVTGALTIASIGLLISYFYKLKKRRPGVTSGFKNLTNHSKIPKLTNIRRHNSSS